VLQGGSNMTGTDFFKTIFAKHLLAKLPSNSISHHHIINNASISLQHQINKSPVPYQNLNIF
jgi:hypothetical protein